MEDITATEVFMKGVSKVYKKTASLQRTADEREERISMEIVVDAYGAEEQAMGWYYYLDDQLQFPFKARCIRIEAKSPLHLEEQVSVLKMASESECEDAMWVQVEWQNRKFAVPLAQLQPIETDESTQTAVDDWHYWVERGYLF